MKQANFAQMWFLLIGLIGVSNVYVYGAEVSEIQQNFNHVTQFFKFMNEQEESSQNQKLNLDQLRPQHQSFIENLTHIQIACIQPNADSKITSQFNEIIQKNQNFADQCDKALYNIEYDAKLKETIEKFSGSFYRITKETQLPAAQQLNLTTIIQKNFPDDLKINLIFEKKVQSGADAFKSIKELETIIKNKDATQIGKLIPSNDKCKDFTKYLDLIQAAISSNNYRELIDLIGPNKDTIYSVSEKLINAVIRGFPIDAVKEKYNVIATHSKLTRLELTTFVITPPKQTKPQQASQTTEPIQILNESEKQFIINAKKLSTSNTEKLFLAELEILNSFLMNLTSTTSNFDEFINKVTLLNEQLNSIKLDRQIYEIAAKLFSSKQFEDARTKALQVPNLTNPETDSLNNLFTNLSSAWRKSSIPQIPHLTTPTTPPVAPATTTAPTKQPTPNSVPQQTPLATPAPYTPAAIPEKQQPQNLVVATSQIQPVPPHQPVTTTTYPIAPALAPHTPSAILANQSNSNFNPNQLVILNPYHKTGTQNLSAAPIYPNQQPNQKPKTIKTIQLSQTLTRSQTDNFNDKCSTLVANLNSLNQNKNEDEKNSYIEGIKDNWSVAKPVDQFKAKLLGISDLKFTEIKTNGLLYGLSAETIVQKNSSTSSKAYGFISNINQFFIDGLPIDRINTFISNITELDGVLKNEELTDELQVCIDVMINGNEKDKYFEDVTQFLANHKDYKSSKLAAAISSIKQTISKDKTSNNISSSFLTKPLVIGTGLAVGLVAFFVYLAQHPELLNKIPLLNWFANK